MTMFHYGVLLKRSATLSHDDFLKTWLGPTGNWPRGFPGW